MDAPSLDRALGGPVGGRASPHGLWFRPAPWAFAVATLAWLSLMLRQLPCLADPTLQYKAFCYSDVTALWGARHIDEALVPYLETELEYPVLTGAFIHVTRLLSGLLGPTASMRHFFGLTAVLLFGCFLGLVAVHLRLGGRWDALLIAGSPLVVASGLINWDLLPVVLTSGALLAWARGRPGWAGALLGLGTATSLYPALLLVPLLVLCARQDRWTPAVRAVAGATFAWLVVNLPVMLAAPGGWAYTLTSNRDGGADLGSAWYVLDGLGVPLGDVSLLAVATLALGVIGVAALLWFAPSPPRLAQGAFLVVVLFCLVNGAYSPQNALWLLPLLVLARPVRLDLAVFTAGELVYWLAIWPYLDGALFAGDGRPVLYWVAVAVRVGVQVWVGWRVARDVRHPWEDPVRGGEGVWRAP